MREKLESLTVDQLRDMAKEKGIKASSKTKSEIIDLLIQVCESEPKPTQDSTGEICEGIFEIVELESEHSKRTVGFIRCENFLPGVDDVYVSNQQIYKYDLRTGDILKGIKKHQREGEKYAKSSI